MSEVQAFERHPQLSRWIEQIASTGHRFSWATWCAFLREINRALEGERRRGAAIQTAGLTLLGTLERYGFPVSAVASDANMSVEARNLHNAARRFQVAIHATGRAADEPALTNGE